MKARILLSLVVGLSVMVPVQASSGPAQLTAGHQKMLEWCGQARITGKTFSTPLGPGREIVGSWVGKPILGGFAVEGIYTYEGKGPNGETEAKELISYDPVTNEYTYMYLADNGLCEQSPFTQDGAVAAWQTTITRDGKEYQLRGRDTDLTDDSGYVRKEEISTDGRTWQPFHEAKFVFAETDSSSEEEELLRLEKEAWKAATKNDIATMDRILADEFIGVYGDIDDNPVWTKEFLYSTLKSRRYVLMSIAYDDLKVRVNGNAGVVTGITTTKETFDGEDLSGRFRFTSTWRKEPGGWQCVGDHAVPIPDKASEVERNKAVLRRVFDEVFNGHKLDVVDEIYHEDFVMHGLGDSDRVGMEVHKEMIAQVLQRIPDYHEDLQQMTAGRDFVACSWISSGTNAQSGNRFSRPCISMYRLADGKIIEQWIRLGHNAPTAELLEGVWVMQEQETDGLPDDRENRKALKFYQDGAFVFVDWDTSTGRIKLAGGGDYSFDGKTLVETVHFVNLDEYLPYRGISLTNTIRFDAESFHQSGDRMGSTLEEVWKRVTPRSP